MLSRQASIQGFEQLELLARSTRIVPEMRLTEHYEWRAIEILLTCLAKEGGLDLPFCIEHQKAQSPDFILSSRSERVGVEATRAVFEEYARADYLHQMK